MALLSALAACGKNEVRYNVIWKYTYGQICKSTALRSCQHLLSQLHEVLGLFGFSGQCDWQSPLGPAFLCRTEPLHRLAIVVSSAMLSAVAGYLADLSTVGASLQSRRSVGVRLRSACPFPAPLSVNLIVCRAGRSRDPRDHFSENRGTSRTHQVRLQAPQLKPGGYRDRFGQAHRS